MSYRLEYQWEVFHVAAQLHGLTEDRYVVAVEGGDNNVYNTSSGKRARSWHVCMIGTKNQVLMQAVGFAAACEGGGLQPRGRYCTPEAYIRRIRNLIDCGEYSQYGSWSAELSVSDTHAIVQEVRELELEIGMQQQYGQGTACISFPPNRYADYFALLDKYHLELSAWCWAEVWGLPSA